MNPASLRWLILALLCLSTVINYVDRQALAIVVPRLREDLGLTSVQYGTVTTLFMVAYTVAQIGSGIMIDRLGTRVGFLISVVVWSIAAVAHAFAQGVWSLGIFRLLLGIGEAGNWPAGGKAIAEWFPKSRRAFAYGCVRRRLGDGCDACSADRGRPRIDIRLARGVRGDRLGWIRVGCCVVVDVLSSRASIRGWRRPAALRCSKRWKSTASR